VVFGWSGDRRGPSPVHEAHEEIAVNRRLLSVLISLTLILIPSFGSPGSAGADEPRLATPRLLQRAVARGEVRRAVADLYLIYALRGDARLPERFRSDVPWHGTVPLLHLKRRVRDMAPGPERERLRGELEALASCGGETGGSNSLDTTHFHIEYGTIGGGLTINDYGTSLETSWNSEVTTFGWAAPPLQSARYLVVVSNLGSGLYGFVTSTGTPSGGNNPNTSWADGDARFSCMALNRDYSGFPSSPQDSLDATTAHEFNHSIQFGYGALNGTVPGDNYIEGGATWMEDEVFDGSDDNYNFLWPNFADGMDSYGASPYAYWITYRGLTERYGTGVGGGGEQVMQDFWELVSQNAANNSTALNMALANRSTTVAAGFHAYAIGAKFMRACGGGYAYPHCFEEGPGYVAVNGLPGAHKNISSVGASTTGSLEGLALNWVQIPADAGLYDLTLTNTGSGGQLRGSAVCDTGSGFRIDPFPSTVGGGAETTLTGFDSAGCLSAVAVLTNDVATGSTGYQLTSASGGGGTPSSLSINDRRMKEGDQGTKTMAFKISLSPASTGTVTVEWATERVTGSARPGVDYKSASGTVTFLPGQTSKFVSVTIFGDTKNEPNERFRVALSNPTGASIADKRGVGRIIDDD
jgi:Calx-beta domain